MKSFRACVCCLGLLSGCVASRPDHFYILTPQPAAGAARTAIATQVVLQVTLPSLVDRNEMIVNGPGDAVTILDHERWAAPLADQVSTTLARDIERRRGDVLVLDRNMARAAAVKIIVNVVQMSATLGGRVSIETHWRITDTRTGRDSLAGEVFSAPVAAGDGAAVAGALSAALSLLADRLAAELPRD